VKAAEENPKKAHVVEINMRMHEGYDHSHHFVAAFIEDHIKHHCEILNASLSASS